MTAAREGAAGPVPARGERVVLTLDAGGTNFTFGAVAGEREVVPPFTVPCRGDDLTACLAQIAGGFARALEAAGGAAAAISFAFPGPADYPAGIIGNPPNLPAFQGGVALGPMLEDRFGLPVFINNDGDLFTYGEALYGLLPEVNRALAAAGSPQRHRNLFGITLGTGFGGGIVSDGRLYRGDNSAAGEIWLLRHRLDREAFAEEGASIRGVRRAYAEAAGIPAHEAPEPRRIAEIAAGAGDTPGAQGEEGAAGAGAREGGMEAAGAEGTAGPAGRRVAAAREAFRRLGVVVGDAVANALTLLDALVVVGGGLSGAAPHFLPEMVAQLNGRLRGEGGEVPRLELTAFNLEDAAGRRAFYADRTGTVAVPGTARRVPYDPQKRTAVGLSRLGTSRAVALGAYAYALEQLDARPHHPPT